ncbi:MAG: hypothetical protein ACE37E_01285 [Hyphomicrobiales bacterium]
MIPDPFSWLRTIAIALGVSAAVGLIAYMKGTSDGREYERQQSLTKSVELLRERIATDDRFQSLSDDDLCIALGGVPDERTGECL